MYYTSKLKAFDLFLNLNSLIAYFNNLLIVLLKEYHLLVVPERN